MSYAGLTPVMRLTQDCGLHGLLAGLMRLDSLVAAIRIGKIGTIITG